MSEEMRTLIYVLQKICDFNWRHVLYMSGQSPWKADSLCVVLDPEDSEDPGKIPPQLAAKNGLRYVLDVQEVKMILENAKKQLGVVSDERALEAFNYYMRHDAYKSFVRQH